jgi:predicted nuclease of predicted toxin-antitoxin system
LTRLFISLYLDEDVDILLADLLRARGFDVTTTQEAGNAGAGDIVQIEYAIAQQKTFLTHNRTDFGEIHKKFVISNKHHFGIIIAVRRHPYELARRVFTILNRVAADEIENMLR